jgi:hypothetical protein
MIRLHHSLALFSIFTVAAFLAGCGGSSNHPMSGASWSVSVSQTGSFVSSGVAQYSITVSNSGTAATSGVVAVNDSLPGLLTASRRPDLLHPQ